MKILVVTNVFPNSQQPNYGIFIQQRVEQVNQFCEMKVVSPVPYFPPLKINPRWYRFSKIPLRENLNGIDIFHPFWFVLPKIGTNISGVSFFFSILGEVKKIRKIFDFDLIDAHCIYPDGVGAVLLAKLIKKPIVLSARGTDINLYTQYPIVRKQIIYALKNATKIIVVSIDLKKKIIELGIESSKITVIPNGVDTEKFKSLSKLECRKKLNLPIDKKIILSIGNLIHGKGFHHLLDALSNLKKRENLLLIIIGEGAYQKKLEEKIDKLEINSYVKLVGSKPHQELPLWYNAADIFCTSSIREGCPNVVLESLACGLPVIATNVGGVSEIITSQELGIVIEYNEKSVNELIDAIEKGLEKKWDRNKLVEEVKERKWTKVGENVYKVFESIMQEEENKK